MTYALLIYDDDSTWTNLPESERATLRAAEMPKWVALFEELGKADPNVSGKELDGRSTAKVVRVRDGAPPFLAEDTLDLQLHVAVIAESGGSRSLRFQRPPE